MNSKEIAIGAVAALAGIVFGGIFVAGLVGGNQSDQTFGGTRFPGGISGDSTSPSPGEVRGTTLTSTGAATLNSATITNQLTAAGDIVADTLDLVVDVSANAVGFGTSTPNQLVQFAEAPVGDGTVASTTIEIGAATTTSRGQINWRQTDGGISCVYVNAAGTGLVAQDGACTE